MAIINQDRPIAVTQKSITESCYTFICYVSGDTSVENLFLKTTALPHGRKLLKIQVIRLDED